MKIYLLCTLDSEHYREPYFYFFEAAFAAHKMGYRQLSQYYRGKPRRSNK